MHLSHVNVTMPKGSEEKARAFYPGLLGLREIPKPESFRSRGGVWFDAGGLDVHLSTNAGRPALWKRFYVHDPFGNRIDEIHEFGGLRA